MNKIKTEINTHIMDPVSALSAISIVLSYIEITLPLSPDFVKQDISEFINIIAVFIFNPFPGVCVEFMKNVLGLFSSNTGWIGELANFIIGGSMVLSAEVVYGSIK